MIKIILLILLSSCYYKDKLTNLFYYKGNMESYNDISYEVERTIKLNEIEIFKKDFILIKNPKKEKLILKDTHGNLILTLEDKKLIFTNTKEKTTFVNNTLNRVIYYTFLYNTFEIRDLLKLLDINKYQEISISGTITKISYDQGYFIYDNDNKTLKELVLAINEKGKIIESKIFLDYVELNESLILKDFKLEIESGKNIITMHEKLKENYRIDFN